MRELLKRPPHAVVVRSDDVGRVGKEIRQCGGVQLQDCENWHVWLLGSRYLVVVSMDFHIPGTW